MDIEATIALQQSIPVFLTATDPKTGNPIPNATISGVVWNQDNPIGAIAPTTTPNKYLFTPSKAGTTHIWATGVVDVK